MRGERSGPGRPSEEGVGRNRQETQDGKDPTAEQLSSDYSALSDEQKREVNRRAGEESETYFRKRWEESKRSLTEKHDALMGLFIKEPLYNIDEKKLAEVLGLEDEEHETLVAMLKQAIDSLRIDEHHDSRERVSFAERLGVDPESLNVDFVMAMTKHQMGREILREDEVTRKSLEYLSSDRQIQEAQNDFSLGRGWYFENPDGQAALGRIVKDVSVEI